MIYVDHIIVLADEKEIERLKQAFIQTFCWIMMEIGNAHSYLGMQLIIEDRSVQ